MRSAAVAIGTVAGLAAQAVPSPASATAQSVMVRGQHLFDLDPMPGLAITKDPFPANVQSHVDDRHAGPKA